MTFVHAFQFIGDNAGLLWHKSVEHMAIAAVAVATATLAGFFGGGGLGDIISNQASYGLDGVVGAAIVVTVLALGTDGLLAGVQYLITPRGLRGDTELLGAAAEYEATRAAPETA